MTPADPPAKDATDAVNAMAATDAARDVARRRFVTGLWMGATGAVLFAGKAIIIKIAYRYGTDATTLLGLRMLYAAPLFAAIAWAVSARRGARALGPPAQWRPRDGWRIVGIGLVGYYLSSYLDFMGLQYISAGLERIILYLSPSVVLLLSFALWRRPIVKAQWIALALCYAGTLGVLGADLRQQGPNVALGSALVFGSAVTYAIYLIASGQLVKRLGALRLTSLATLVACTACVAQALVLRGGAMGQQPWQVHALSVLNAVVCTFVPLFLMMMSIERVGAAIGAQVGMVGPASTIVMAAVFLGEPITALQVLGTATVLAGALMLSRAAPRPAPLSAPPSPAASA